MRATDNQQYRARLYAIEKLIGMYPDHARILRNGLVPKECKYDFEILENEAFRDMFNRKIDNSIPLSFVELCSFNTWFAIHPEKVAGEEIITTSVHFPVSIKGTKEDIIATIEKTLNKNKSDRIRIAKVKAKAKLKLLELMKI
jgi:hypothetical protein